MDFTSAHIITSIERRTAIPLGLLFWDPILINSGFVVWTSVVDMSIECIIVMIYLNKNPFTGTLLVSEKTILFFSPKVTVLGWVVQKTYFH